MSDPPAPAQAAPEKALLDAHLRMLGRLAEAGLEIAMALERRAKAAEPEEGACDPSIDLDAVALAYSRVSRAVRLCILLQSRLLEGPSPASQKLNKKRRADLDKVKADVGIVMESIAEARQDAGEPCEHLAAECAERLDHEAWDALLERPIEDLIADICRDLGVDWPLWSTHPWVRCAVQHVQTVKYMQEGRYEVFWQDENGMPQPADECALPPAGGRWLAEQRAAGRLPPEPVDSG